MTPGVVYPQIVLHQAMPSRRQIPQVPGDCAYVHWQNAALPIRRTIMNQIRQVHPYLVAGWNSVLQFVLLHAIVIMQRQEGVCNMCSAISDRGDVKTGEVVERDRFVFADLLPV
jgi:hypothetical protein